MTFSAGMIYAAQGKRAEALTVIKELEERCQALQQAHFIAKIYATLNDKELTFSWLDAAWPRDLSELFIKWDTIRDDPRYADLLHRMNLPE